MQDSATTTHALCRCARIRALNDQLRIQQTGGRFVMTRGVASLDLKVQVAMFVLLRSFTAFNVDNDPHGEHDMGSLEIGDINVLWKIDYFDRQLEYGSPDPADPAVTSRVLTLMRAEEY